MNWSKPDLDRVRNACCDYGLDPYAIRNDSFMTRCPVHEGEGHSATFWLDHNGNVAFHCHAYGCGFTPMMMTLDLLPADFFIDPYPKKTREVSQDKAFIVVAENDIGQGKRLSESEMDQYKAALLRAEGLAL